MQSVPNVMECVPSVCTVQSVNTQIINCERGKGRKKLRNLENWKRVVNKGKQYSPKSLPKLPQCKHVGKSLKCCELSMQDIRKFHQAFCSEKNKQIQDSFILKYTQKESPKRMRPRGAVSYTHLDVYKRQPEPPYVPAPYGISVCCGCVCH